tara:strand:+ start:204 stop:500 length:297 start_codon:yes stop_codon:yes gene_type:complete
MFVEIKKSTNPKKKLMAIFYDDNKKKIKTIHFGSAGMSDFTIHKDKERKKRYLSRHQKRENWTIPMTAGSLSRWILWDKPDLQKSINAYMKRFKLKKY